MKIFCSILLLFYTCSHLLAQKLTRGVIEDLTGVPVEYASIQNNASKKGVISNSEGRFAIEAKEQDTLIISCIGFNRLEITPSQIEKEKGKIYLVQQLYTLDELTVEFKDAASVMKKVHKRIHNNYYKKAMRIDGIYKVLSSVEGEIYSLFDSDIELYFDGGIGSSSLPIFETKLNNYKLYANKNSLEYPVLTKSEGHLRSFWLYEYNFLWAFKYYTYNYVNSVRYNDMSLIRIDFAPRKTNMKIYQSFGSVFINPQDYSIIYLHYKMLPNRIEYQVKNGKMQSLKDAECKLLFEKEGKKYIPQYIIQDVTISGIVDDWHSKNNQQDTIDIKFLFNFFTQNVEYKPELFVSDSLSIDELILTTKSQTIEQTIESKYAKGFVLDTKIEKVLKE